MCFASPINGHGVNQRIQFFFVEIEEHCEGCFCRFLLPTVSISEGSFRGTHLPAAFADILPFIFISMSRTIPIISIPFE